MFDVEKPNECMSDLGNSNKCMFVNEELDYARDESRSSGRGRGLVWLRRERPLAEAV